MKPRCQSFRVRASWLALLVALCLGGGRAAAADKKPDEKKAPEKKADEPKKAVDPKAAAKEAPPVTTNTPPILVAFPKAVFNTALEAGRDPFFPASKRRVPKAPQPPEPVKPPPVIPVVVPPVVVPPRVVNVPPTTNAPPASTNLPPVVVVPPPDLIGSANLTLRGLSGVQARRVAVVYTGARSYDFRKGDTTLIRLPSDKQLRVRCVDIRERSAVFQAEGETGTKELFLREGL